MHVLYYRSCGRPQRLYRVEADVVKEAKGGGIDLSEVPEGVVSVWTGLLWEPSALPPVGDGPDCVRHTKNVAGIGVGK